MPTIDSGYINRRAIAGRVAELGQAITSYYSTIGDKDDKLILIGLLKGSFIFLADLVREIGYPHTVDFMIVRSYGTGKTPENMSDATGWVKLLYTPRGLHGRHVLVVDDILGTGTTLAKVCNILREQQPKSLEVCVLLQNDTISTKSQDHPRFIGFNLTCPEFVVGYGLDKEEHLRHLPFIIPLSRLK